ncbi:hypothetical protein D4764_07G0004290 [Takifugu flavidus]|uniref:Uncharacterized protein n=1 Tax=Takifugu flavidus TaxID=433684 RepID=A0A5C6MW25_9TELE|nr:hypothetical protein D4764_07G0004290 [Takifugu flavidus]
MEAAAEGAVGLSEARDGSPLSDAAASDDGDTVIGDSYGMDAADTGKAPQCRNYGMLVTVRAGLMTGLTCVITGRGVPPPGCHHWLVNSCHERWVRPKAARPPANVSFVLAVSSAAQTRLIFPVQSRSAPLTFILCLSG